MFSVPEFVAQQLFPLNPAMVGELKAEGFQIITATTTEEAAFTEHIQGGIASIKQFILCVCQYIGIKGEMHVYAQLGL